MMLRIMCAMCICLATVVVFGQPETKYQVATIVEVKTHPASGDSASAAASYDVSLKVGDTIYLVLYTSPLGMNTVKYTVGRELLVLVGEKTIRYNDILGQSLEVPIVSRKRASDAKQSK